MQSQIERILHVSDEEEKRGFKHLWYFALERGIREHHLWLSVFFRNERVRFTRCQRLTTAMAMLYLSMLANALWYHWTEEKEATGWKLDPFIISPVQFVVGFVANLVIIPIILLIIFLFRVSERRKQRENHATAALNAQHCDG